MISQNEETGQSEAATTELPPSKKTLPIHDLIIVGGGSAAAQAARTALRMGADVVLAAGENLEESSPRDTVEPIHAFRAVAQIGDRDGSVEFLAVADAVRRARRRAAEDESPERLRELGAEVHLGEARFTGPESLEIDGRGMRFRRAILATGSRSLDVRLDEAGKVDCLTESTLLDLAELPRRLAVVGTGPRMCAWAQIFRRLGCQVHLVGCPPVLLPWEDAAAAGAVQDQLEEEGVRMHLSCDRFQVEATAKSPAVILEQGDNREKLFVDHLMAETTRVPEVDGLGLERAGVLAGRRGVVVDDHARTTNRRIFAAGAVCGLQYASPQAARAMGRLAARNALGWRRHSLGRLVFPQCVWTDPAIARVGLTPAETKERSIEIETYRVSAEDVLARAERRPAARREFVTVHLAPASGRVVGAVVLAREPAEVIGPLSLLMSRRLPITALDELVPPGPSGILMLKRIAEVRGRNPRHRHFFPVSGRFWQSGWVSRILRVRGKTTGKEVRSGH